MPITSSATKSILAVTLIGLTACKPSPSAGDETLGAKLQGIVDDYSLASISVAVLRHGKLAYKAARGHADIENGKAASTDTIYSLASVSKPVVGMAIAHMIEKNPSFDLDADINDYLKWSQPPRNPTYQNDRITMRHLVLHTSGIVSDSDADYDTYPKPDPNNDLDAYLRPLLAQQKYWGDAKPGTAKSYSNLGVALAALVVERVTGKPFNTYCNENIFTPLGMNDTRWFFKELGPAQQDRVAIPYEGAGDARVRLLHYGFEDWPSGQLRSTAVDYARLLAMLMAGGAPVLSQTSVGTFETVPLLIEAEGGTFNHSGGEAGVTAFGQYNKGGAGYVFLVNNEIADSRTDKLFADLDAIVASLPDPLGSH